MLVSGVLTFTAIIGLFSPELILNSMFGESFAGELSDVIVRSWSALVALVGAMLIYAANRPIYRSFVLTVAGLGKIIFVSLLVLAGGQILQGALVAVAMDSLTVLLFALYLLSSEGVIKLFNNNK